jgi:acyl-coenzyme A thioesterase PaaI-like protein
VVIHTGGRVATAEGRVFSARSGKLIATGTCSCVILREES